MLHLALATTLLASTNASASPAVSVKAAVQASAAVRHFRDIAISPDGERAVWTQRAPDAEGRQVLGAISVSGVEKGKPRRLTAASDGKPHREWGGVFSPDNRTIAFLSDAAESGQQQIWVAPAAGGAPRQVTRVKGQLAHLLWARDGRRIAFLFVEGSGQETGALTAYKPDSGVVQETFDEQRIAVADLKTGDVRLVSPADRYVYDYDWSSDGKTFAAEAVQGSGTNNYWIAELDAIDASTGAVRTLWKPPLQIACPRFSPDGKAIALIHGIMSDEGSTGGDVWTVPAAGGAPRNLTPDARWSAKALFWRPSGEILIAAHVDGGEGVGKIDPKTAAFERLWAGAEAIDDFAPAESGENSALIHSSFQTPPEACAGELGEWRPLSAANAGAKKLWGEAKSLRWQSGHDSVQGWLIYPLGFDPARRYPMITIVHGGPSGTHQPRWPDRWTGTLPSQGYFVFLPNPRGSYGFGEAFVQGNVKDFGGGDLQDILRGVDAALAVAPIDGKRLGITGWSYGGYMAMWAVTQTNRFAAAVAGAGIVSWQSYYGQNKIDTWMLPFFGASVYDDPKVYAKSSPIEFIKNVKTPTLVLHGDRDSEVPTPQGYEFWHALKSLGVPTQLVIYTGEGHDIRRADHRLDIQERTVAWFDKYLK
ncbi:MAG TPA: S9 family peptidase [Thermoanaerobaculia bacterium]|nr:S9 family peptidase [Thermoanaerobaculia bacterium]